MNAHVFDELPQLLTGDADRATVTAATAHLRECDDCRDALIAAVAAHAALMSAAKYAADLLRPGDDLESGHFAAHRDQGGDLVGSQPDLAAMFAQVRAEVDAEEATGTTGATVSPLTRPVDRRPRRVWLAAAAAVLVLGVGGGTYLATQSGTSDQSTRSLSLQPFGEGTTSAQAKLIGDNEMNLDASSLPRLDAGSYYEVWLTNGARTSMAPVGILDADRKATITVPATEMANYGAIEVSVQKTAGVGTYSGHSVLRGDYA